MHFIENIAINECADSIFKCPIYLNNIQWFYKNLFLRCHLLFCCTHLALLQKYVIMSIAISIEIYKLEI